MPEIVFGLEKFADIMDEIKPLFQLHYDEIAHYKDIKLSPNYEAYTNGSESGGIKCFTARKNGQLVGYNFFFVYPNMHYSESLQAVQDIIFIHPSHRGFGKKLIQYCDDQLKTMGVQVVYHHLKAAHNFGPMLESIGYRLVDLIYSKRLD